MNKGKKFNLPIKISSVIFAPTNRAWAAATTEGIYLYSLDSSLTFSPLMLDIDVTPQSALDAFKEKAFLKALIYAIYLNNTELMNLFVNTIPVENIQIISNKIPFNIVGALLDFLAEKLNTDSTLELCLL